MTKKLTKVKDLKGNTFNVKRYLTQIINCIESVEPYLRDMNKLNIQYALFKLINVRDNL